MDNVLNLSTLLIESLSIDQLRLLCEDRHADSSHSAYWLETIENKMWEVRAYARALNDNQCVCWIETDENGISDVEVVDIEYHISTTYDSILHAHLIASELDGRGPLAYVIGVVQRWEAESDNPKLVTEETIDDRLQEWIDGDGDRETVLVAQALLTLV